MDSVTYLILRRLRRPLITLLSIYAISMLGFTLIPGIDDKGEVYRMDFFHAFYFVSYMGSTIGFGELPYPFTNAQRLWTLMMIYLTVIGWLYTIGSIFSLIQDPTLHKTLSLRNISKTVSKFRQPFYIVCGFGDTGYQVINALARLDIRTVAIDSDIDKINELELQNYSTFVPGICANAADSRILTAAGIKSPLCEGVLAITDNDLVNLKIALSCKLLHKNVKVIARVENRHIKDNMESFGTDVTINPFESFAEMMVIATRSPSQYLLNNWLTSRSGAPLAQPIFPPSKGHWIICGYGRFGHAMNRALTDVGIDVIVIDANPNETNPPKQFVFGVGTEAHTLRAANIENAVAIVAANDDDSNNLSTIMTARSLNPNLFLVSRQSESVNDALFQAADLNLINHHSEIVARRTLAHITTPLTKEFILLTVKKENEWSSELISRICAVIGDTTPYTWVINIKSKGAAAVWRSLQDKRAVFLRHLMRDPTDRSVVLDCIPLMIKRPKNSVLVPDGKEALRKGDCILFCGTEEAELKMRRIAKNYEDLYYSRTGVVRPSGYVWRKLNKHIEK